MVCTKQFLKLNSNFSYQSGNYEIGKNTVFSKFPIISLEYFLFFIVDIKEVDIK